MGKITMAKTAPRVHTWPAIVGAVVLVVATVAGGLALASGGNGDASGTGSGHTGSGHTGSGPVTRAPDAAGDGATDSWPKLDLLLGRRSPHDGSDLPEDPHRVHTADGRTLPLAGTRTFNWVVRVPDGWLFSRLDEDVRLMRLDGSTIELGIGFVVTLGRPVGTSGETLAISVDGRSVAWTVGGTAHAARLAADGLHDRVSTPVPAETSVITWIGRRVVLGQAYANGCCGYRPMQYDVWDPRAGGFSPRWTAGVEPVYGPVPEGRGLGLVKVDPARDAAPAPGCLAELDGERDMSVVNRTCLPGLRWGSTTGQLSPDGRHLAISRDGDQPVMIIDTLTATVAQDCAADTPAAWEDDHHLLARAGHRTGNGADVVRCTLGRSGVTVLDPTMSTPDAPVLVPRYGDR